MLAHRFQDALRRSWTCRDCGVPMPMAGPDGKALVHGECPHCGAMNPYPTPRTALIVVVLILLAAFILGRVVGA